MRRPCITRDAAQNHKGGVTKTTSTANLGAMLAERGRRVLIVTPVPAWRERIRISTGELSALADVAADLPERGWGRL
ncbi:MAG: ParA family protein [Solirubrobacteraceae bacterium]